MLSAWLGEQERAAFRETRQAARPHAAVGIVGEDAAALFAWTTLDGLLRAHPPPDVLVVHDGEHLVQPPPTTAGDVRSLMRDGTGLVIRRAEQNDQALARLAKRFAAEFESSVHVQLFVTPGQTRGFRWHYDREDVVILQTLGTKTYYFRDNTQVADLDSDLQFEAIATERSPLYAATLCARDALYLPRGIWHMGKAHDHAFSISVGMSAGVR